MGSRSRKSPQIKSHIRAGKKSAGSKKMARAIFIRAGAKYGE